MLDPIETAQKIFKQSLTALMAHVIRGTQNHFHHHGLNLQVVIMHPKPKIVPLQEPGKGVTSILYTYLVPSNTISVWPTVKAAIHIHPEANRNLARVCVAHEIFHLLLELDKYEKNQDKIWSQIHRSKELEDNCNLFAWEICKKHDDFYRDENRRKNAIYFPDRLFDGPMNIDPAHQDIWPPGLGLDPAHPFYATEYLS